MQDLLIAVMWATVILGALSTHIMMGVLARFIWWCFCKHDEYLQRKYLTPECRAMLEQVERIRAGEAN